MTRQMPFQYDRPVFVKIPFDGHGITWNQGKEFKWKELGVDEVRVKVLYDTGYLYHNSEMEVTTKVGDGLEELGIEGLHALVDSINEKVQVAARNKTEYDKKKCRTSKIADKQRGLIRSWRRSYGDLEKS